MNHSDIDTIRSLAGQVAEIASLPIHDEKRTMWRKLNAKQPDRPMVMIDQVCWNEMDVDNELTLRCEDEECRGYEGNLRRLLFQWKHFPVDMVVEPFVRIPRAISGTNPYSDAFGIYPKDEVVSTDPDNPVVAHLYANQLQNEDDLEKIKEPQVVHDEAETARREEVAHKLFNDVIEFRMEGCDPYVGAWDPISSWMSVEGALLALIDSPEFMHRLTDRVVSGILSVIDQLEEQNLFCGPQSTVHCTGAYTDELPAEGYNASKPRAKDRWMFGLAQMFSSASPAMFKEFEIDYTRRICERFGMVYYGCCDPLDGKMNEVRLLPNVRKVSMSPFVDQARGAAEIGTDYVYSRKPPPSYLAMDEVDTELVRNDLQESVDVCKKHGCPLEIILKDISTIRYDPQRLFDWADMAMRIVDS